MNNLKILARARFTFLAVVAISTLVFAGLSPLQAQLSKGKGSLRVMTYNVDQGTNFVELASATSQTAFLVAVGQTISQVRATNPPSRMQAVAKQILAAAPQLVSLQELAKWSSGPLLGSGQCGTVSLEFDMLQELLTALGPSYTLAYQGLEYQFPPVPGLIGSTFLCVQLQNYVTILARTDVADSLTLTNLQSGQYINKAAITTPLGPFPLPRAWVAADANFDGKVFRFIGTHLESDNAALRQLQGAELRAGPANTALPVVIAMDSNAQASPPPQDPTYTDFINAGYKIHGWGRSASLAVKRLSSTT